VRFQTSGDSLIVMLTGSPLTVLKFSSSGSLEGQLIMNSENGDYGGFFLDDDDFVVGGLTS
jgi:hypothetical protein